MKRSAIDRLLEILPDDAGIFEGSAYPMPVHAAFLGSDTLDAESLRKELDALHDSDVKDVLEPALLASERFESVQSDRQKFFITDAQVRDYVFMGSKWTAGWALVLGARGNKELCAKLIEKGFYVFTDVDGIEGTYFIGTRETSPIYFLQMMVRYGLIWGRIQPGDDHEMGHFLEKDMPGFMIITEGLTPLKYMVSLGIMKLGAPALVPQNFPFPYGNRITTDDPLAIVENGVYFPNLRMRYYKDEVISLPEGCNTAYANEAIKGGIIYGCTETSFFHLRRAKVDCTGLFVEGNYQSGIGILVDIDHEALDMDLEMIVEQGALKAINYLPGLKAGELDGKFYIRCEPGALPDFMKVGDAIRCGIRLHYPRLERIGIRFIFDERELGLLSIEARLRKTERKAFVSQMTEENTREFCACIECRPFSLEHTCILTPDRIPMCASRTYFSVKAESLLGSSVVPYRRQSDRELALKSVFDKGTLLDADKGEYEGCNKVYTELTGRRLNRVYLHSLRGYPHTSCGCFQNLAFWIEEVQGIGIMSRGSKAIAPNGKTWDMLANSAGGKQSDGIMGVSLHYIRSRYFLKGDGGIGNVVWIDHALQEKIAGCFLPGQAVATELNAATMDELRLVTKR